MENNKILIWTDGGAKNNGNKNKIVLSAWAYTMNFGEHTKEDSGIFINGTNQMMEIRAVIEALKALKRTDIPVIIYSDSAYVCNCIKDRWYAGWIRNGWRNAKGKDVANQDLWKELLKQIERFESIELHKVRGHSDNKGNNRADELVNLEMDKHEKGKL